MIYLLAVEAKSVDTYILDKQNKPTERSYANQSDRILKPKTVQQHNTLHFAVLFP